MTPPDLRKKNDCGVNDKTTLRALGIKWVVKEKRGNAKSEDITIREPAALPNS